MLHFKLSKLRCGFFRVLSPLASLVGGGMNNLTTKICPKAESFNVRHLIGEGETIMRPANMPMYKCLFLFLALTQVKTLQGESGKITPRVKPKPFGFEPYPKSASKLENVGSSSEILYEMNTTREEKQINSNSKYVVVSVNVET